MEVMRQSQWDLTQQYAFNIWTSFVRKTQVRKSESTIRSHLKLTL